MFGLSVPYSLGKKMVYMSFLKNLFSHKGQEDASQSLALEEFPELYEGMALDIVSSDGKLLFTARLTAFSQDGHTLERMPGCLAFTICPVGSAVSIRGYNRRFNSFNLSATVQESSRIIFRVSNLTAQRVTNQRLTFRLPMNIPASLYRQDDERFSRPEKCTLVDLSTSGACVESEYIHPEDEVLRVRFKLKDYPTMTFLGQIVRGGEFNDSGMYRYGILFAQLSEDELTSLTRTLYNLQTDSRKEWNETYP